MMDMDMGQWGKGWIELCEMIREDEWKEEKRKVSVQLKGGFPTLQQSEMAEF